MSVAVVKKGPCTVKYGGNDLGYTEGDLTFKYSPEFRLFVPDQTLGPVDFFIVSESIEVMVPLVPRADVQNLAAAKAFAASLLKGTKKTGGGDTTLSAAEAAGQTVLSVTSETNFAAGDLILIDAGTPMAEVVEVLSTSTGEITLATGTPLRFAHASGATVIELDADPKLRLALGGQRANIPTAELLLTPVDGSAAIKIYKALVTGEVEHATKKGEESIVELTFTALEDTSRAAGDRMATIGDMSVA